MSRGAVWVGLVCVCVGCEAKAVAPDVAPEAAPDVAPDVAASRPAARDMAASGALDAGAGDAAQDAGADVGGLGAFGVSGIGVGGSGPIEPAAPPLRALPAGFKVELERVEVVGALEQALAERLWRRGRLELASCYAEALERDGGLAGGLVVELVIVKQRVMQAKLEAPGVGDEALRRCVAGRMYRWAYPEAPGMVRARHVMRFGR